MDKNLGCLISDYQAAVRDTVEYMAASGISLPESCNDWVGNNMPQYGELENGVRYFKHGFGIAVRFSDRFVNFDFGLHGEIDGFDELQLIGFAAHRLNAYGFVDETALRSSFEAAKQAGAFIYSGYRPYYLAPKQEAQNRSQ